MKPLDYLLISSCLVFVVAVSYPITSQPLTNNPDSWALEDSWLIFNPKNSVSLAEPLIASYDLKAKKITPKSIFIAPNSNFLTGAPGKSCQPGQRIDENGNCIKIVTVNQDELILHQLHQLLHKGDDAGSNSNIDYGDYDYGSEDSDEQKFEESQGPQKFVLPLVIENNPEFNGNKHVAEDNKKIGFIIDDEDPKPAQLNNEKTKTTVSIVPQTTTFIPPTLFSDDENVEDTTHSTIFETLPTEVYSFYRDETDRDEILTTTELPKTTELPTTTDLPPTTFKTDNEGMETTTLVTENEETTTLIPKTDPTTMEAITTTLDPEEETTTVYRTTTLEPISTRLKSHRQKNRKHHHQNSTSIITESPNYQRSNSRKQKTSSANRSDQRFSNTAIIDRTQLPKKQSLTSTLAYPETTRTPKRRVSVSTSTVMPTIVRVSVSTIPSPPITSTEPSVIWVPRGGSDTSQRQNQPVLIRFWSNMPLVQDNTPVRTTNRPNLNYNFNNNRDSSINNHNFYNFNSNPQSNKKSPNHYNFNYNNNPNNYRRRSHLPQNTGSFRINSRQPSERLFREVSLQELQSVLRL